MQFLPQIAAGAAQSSPFNQMTSMGADMGRQAMGNHFQNQLIDRKEQAFTKWGLPEFYAHMGPNSIPQQREQIRGLNFQNTGPIGMNNIPMATNPWMRRMGFGMTNTGPSPRASAPETPSTDPPPPYSGLFLNPQQTQHANVDAVGRPIKGFWPGQRG